MGHREDKPAYVYLIYTYYVVKRDYGGSLQPNTDHHSAFLHSHLKLTFCAPKLGLNSVLESDCLFIRICVPFLFSDRVSHYSLWPTRQTVLPSTLRAAKAKVRKPGVALLCLIT